MTCGHNDYLSVQLLYIVFTSAQCHLRVFGCFVSVRYIWVHQRGAAVFTRSAAGPGGRSVYRQTYQRRGQDQRGIHQFQEQNIILPHCW